MSTIRNDRSDLMCEKADELLFDIIDKGMTIKVCDEVNELPVNVVSINGHKVILLGEDVKGPLTYMSDSEQAVEDVLELLIVSLDMTIDICQALKEEGSTPENSGEEIVASTLKLFNMTMDEAIEMGFE